MGAIGRTIRCIRNNGSRVADPPGRSFVYINCPNCNKRLIQTRVSVKSQWLIPWIRCILSIKRN